MAYIHPEYEWPDLDPPPTVATSEEIAIADELWRALERKYLGTASPALDGIAPAARERAGDAD